MQTILRHFGNSAEIVTVPLGFTVVKCDEVSSDPGQVLIDASTLLAVGRTMPVILERGLDTALRQCASSDVDGALNFLQSVVIHDKIWVDAMTCAQSALARKIVCDLSPNVGGVIITEQSIYDEAWRASMEIANDTLLSDVGNVELGLSCVEAVDRDYMHPHDVLVSPEDASRADRFIFESPALSEPVLIPRIPASLRDSNSGLQRTLFYVSLSSYLKLPYVPHPERAALIDIMSSCGEPGETRAQRVVKYFDEGILRAWDPVTTRVPGPPVAERVLSVLRRTGDLVSAVTEVREEAGEFRKWSETLK